MAGGGQNITVADGGRLGLRLAVERLGLWLVGAG